MNWRTRFKPDLRCREGERGRDLSKQDSNVGVHEPPHISADLELCPSLF